jgi:hypothetical protein
MVGGYFRLGHTKTLKKVISKTVTYHQTNLWQRK